MKESEIYIAMLDLVRGRLLGSLEAIETSGLDVKAALTFRPGPARSHIAWQAMHCAATHDKYINVYLRGSQIKDPALVEAYGVNSVAKDDSVPDLKTIRKALEIHFEGFKDFIRGLTEADYDRKIEMGPGRIRTIRESIMVMVWHESHHQGQIHLTWNIFKAR